MKKLFVIFLLLSSIFCANSSDFETSQHNYKVSSGNVSYEVRQMTYSEKVHNQLGYQAGRSLFEYRHASSDNSENRFRVTHSLYKKRYVSLSPRLEYRSFEDDGDHFRLRLKTIFTYPIKRFDLWHEFQPGFNFKASELDVQTRTGFHFKMNDRVKFGPFVQVNFDKNFRRKSSWLGTNLSINF